MTGARAPLWIFGYGSLIWRPDFPYLERRPARLHGWQRRFWQGSHDHRGVPDSPGRVVTLVEAVGGHCDGMAYQVERETAERTFEVLDHREKNGYLRRDVDLYLNDAGDTAAAPTPAVVYLAPPGNHAYLGPAALSDMARQIATSHGPSGANADYLLELAEALRTLGAHDSHVFELETAVRTLNAPG